jgi:hypothetical protein
MTKLASTPLTGSCLCGAVRYECAAAPVFSVNCHCRSCQKASGSGYAAICMVPVAALAVTGEVRYYDEPGDSGQNVSRGFCPVCGSQLFGKPAVLPNLVGIKAASLDEPERYQPSADMYTDSAQAWDCMNPSLPKFAKAPPG